ncbi:MAG TPA: hypothetical protein H9662_01050 [Firmicutes bacterium]|nr:hypothetical protein [Bacillota bacterium]
MKRACYICNLIGMAFPHLSSAMDHCVFIQLSHLFLMILGNTFTLGAVKELSRGSIPCIAAHMLIDTAAVSMLVGSDLTKVAVLAGVEIALSVMTVYIFRCRQKRKIYS